MITLSLSSVEMVDDTLVGDPLYAVPLNVVQGLEDLTNTRNVLDSLHLCYEIHGISNQHFNLISDECINVNALYTTFEPATDTSIGAYSAHSCPIFFKIVHIHTHIGTHIHTFMSSTDMCIGLNINSPCIHTHTRADTYTHTFLSFTDMHRFKYHLSDWNSSYRL